jgi:hypothetical protein
LWLEAKEVRDPDSADEIVLSSGGLQFERIRMRKDDVFEFDERSTAYRSPSLREKDMSHQEKKIMRIALKAANRETLTKLAKQFRLHRSGGVRPKRLPDGTLRMDAYVPEELLDELKRAGGDFEIVDVEDATQVGKERQKEVGRGDRFEDGNTVPRGLGRKE